MKKVFVALLIVLGLGVAAVVAICVSGISPLSLGEPLWSTPFEAPATPPATFMVEAGRPLPSRSPR